MLGLCVASIVVGFNYCLTLFWSLELFLKHFLMSPGICCYGQQEKCKKDGYESFHYYYIRLIIEIRV